MSSASSSSSSTLSEQWIEEEDEDHDEEEEGEEEEQREAENLNLAAFPDGILQRSKQYRIGFKCQLDNVERLLVKIPDENVTIKSAPFPSDLGDNLQFRIEINSNSNFMSLNLLLESCQVRDIELNYRYMVFDGSDTRFFKSGTDEIVFNILPKSLAMPNWH